MNLLRLVYLVIALVLSGCSAKVPDCGDTKTVGLVNELILQSLLGDDAKDLSDMFKVEINAIQTISHAKDPERYSCKANIKITTTGKMGELFGSANDEVARMRNDTMTAAEALKLNKYLALVETLEKEPNQIYASVIVDAIVAKGALTLLDIPLGRYFKSDYQFFDTDRATSRATTATSAALATAATLSRLNEPKTIEFSSTTAQQNGEAHHFIEVEKLSMQPDVLLIELAKFSKTYTPTAPSKSANSPHSTTTESASAPDLSQIFPSKACTNASSTAAKLICSNPDLRALDEELSIIYTVALAKHPERANKIREGQMNWTIPRDSCTEIDCIHAIYGVQKIILLEQ